jgi:hypothetical protein
MKVIINNIKVYHIRDNNYYSGGNNNDLKVFYGRTDEADLAESFSRIIIDDISGNDDHPIIAQLKERILQSEVDLNELINRLNSDTK